MSQSNQQSSNTGEEESIYPCPSCGRVVELNDMNTCGNMCHQCYCNICVPEPLADCPECVADRDKPIVVNRFEVINHLLTGPENGRELVIWKDEPFEVTCSLQDDGRTLKVFLSPKDSASPAPAE